MIDSLYGSDGPAWGTKLPDIEDLFVALRDLLGEKMLAEALARQAAAHPQAPTSHRLCPGCQQPLACYDGHERLVATRAGEA